jgi:hypothetical protein
MWTKLRALMIGIYLDSHDFNNKNIFGYSHAQECTAHKRVCAMQRFLDGCIGHDSTRFRSRAPERKVRFI